jgi:hypothetical protein
MSISQCTAFALRRAPPPHPTFAIRPHLHPAAFTEKYRPTTLAEVVGQPHVVARLRKFLADPYPCAMLFEGETGVGKTSAAFALVNDLKVDRAANFFHIKSGCQDGSQVASIADTLRFTPWGNGWRVILLDEADLMTDMARKLWLSVLESLPWRTVLIFTTNHSRRFDQRTLDRFQRYPFSDSVADTLEAAQALADAIWEAETGGGDGPDVNTLPNVIEKGSVSFRRVATAMESVVRFGAVSAPPADTPVPRPRSCAVPRPPVDTPAPPIPPAPTVPAVAASATMRALSVPQPYAWAIVHGDRRVEVRGWRTHHRGPMAIHAGLSRAGSKVRLPGMPAFDDLAFGALIGVVALDDCVPDCKGGWSWTMSDPRPIEPVPCPGGRGGFFDVDASAIREIPESSDKST